MEQFSCWEYFSGVVRTSNSAFVMLGTWVRGSLFTFGCVLDLGRNGCGLVLGVDSSIFAIGAVVPKVTDLESNGLLL